MSQSLPIPPPGFQELSVNEQVEYIEALLSFVAAEPEHVRIPKWHWEILSERIANYRADEGMTWEEFEKELQKELKN